MRLFLPYVPRRHNDAVAVRCPDVRALHEGGVRRVDTEPAAAGQVERILDCLAEIHPVTLNGERLEGLRFRFFTHPQTGLRGVWWPTSRPRGSRRARTSS